MIYFDNAATTKPSEEVVKKINEAFELYGNPSSSHEIGKQAKDLVEEARSHVAKLLMCKPENIIFTSGGTESNNWAIYSQLAQSERKVVITSPIEHHAILETLQNFKKTFGVKYEYVPINKYGNVNLDFLEKQIETYKPSLVSIMYANNEIGTIQPIYEIVQICKKYNIAFHTDAVQAVGKIYVDAVNSGVDMLSLSAHKFHGPKGIGALYVRDGFDLFPFMSGGHQENSLRAGTHNVPGIAGLGEAARLINPDNFITVKRLEMLLWEKIESMNLGAKRNGSQIEETVPGILNITFPETESKMLVNELNKYGICCSSGSACNEGQTVASHVLSEIGLSTLDAHSTIRISLSKYSDYREVEELIRRLPLAVKKAKVSL